MERAFSPFPTMFSTDFFPRVVKGPDCLAEQILFNKNNFLDWSKFEEFADDKIIVTQKQKFFSGLVANIVGKEENAGH